jgi:plastocyanin
MSKGQLTRAVRWTAPLAALLALSVSALASASPSAHAAGAPRSATVVLKNISFNPTRVVVRRGGTVKWEWRDGTGVAAVPHTLTSVGRTHFRGQGPRTSGNYSVRFTHPGTYQYICQIHPGMHGEIVVR